MSTTTIATVATDQLVTVLGGASGSFSPKQPQPGGSTGHIVVDPSAIWGAFTSAGAAFSTTRGNLVTRVGSAIAWGAASLSGGIHVEWDK